MMALRFRRRGRGGRLGIERPDAPTERLEVRVARCGCEAVHGVGECVEAVTRRGDQCHVTEAANGRALFWPEGPQDD